jgi:DivIVA domain-containing protein
MSVYSGGMPDSFSRPDLTSPTSVAETSFSTALRGYRPEEVRLVLRDVADEIARLHTRIDELTEELNRQDGSRLTRSGALRTGDLDDETVRQLLGEEMVKVLQTAREAAAEVVERGEQSAAQLIREASTQAAVVRQEAELEAARLRADASLQAQVDVDRAREQGREMVEEAQAYRERWMAETSRRRDAVREQIDQLLQGRDKMVQVFERAQQVAREVLEDLGSSVASEPYSDLRAGDSGPVPVVPPSAETPPFDQTAFEEEATAEEFEAEETVLEEAVLEEIVLEEAVVDEIVDVVVDEAVVEEVPDAVTDDDQTGDDRSNVVDLFPGRSVDGPTVDGPTVDGLFAKLRAGSAEAQASQESASVPEIAEPAAPTAPPPTAEPRVTTSEPELDDSPFGQREAAVVPLIVAAARRIKRILADEQNEVLGSMRSAPVVASVEDLVADSSAHTTRYVEAMMEELLGAHGAGAAISAGAATSSKAAIFGGAAPALDAADLERITGFVSDGLVEPLRSRLDRAVLDGGGDIDDTIRRVRAVYREWKTQHIDQHLEDVMRLSFGLGVLAGVPVGTKMCWRLDPHGEHCPDAEDNSLAGAVAAGEPYPTGHTFAPAYAGCRCLVLPAAELTESS